MSSPVYEQSAVTRVAMTPAEDYRDYREDVEPFYERAPSDGTRTLAKALGWFSIGLGLSELMFPRQLGRAIGIGDHPTLLPMLGLREIGSGIAILTQSDPSRAVQSRVAGDVLDLALLGAALTSDTADRARVATATAAVVGVTALDAWCAGKLSRASLGAYSDSGAVSVTKSIAVNRPAAELYRHWRKLENLPQVMRHLESVQELDSKRSHWVARGPAHMRVEWDAEITSDLTNEVLAWRSVANADVPNQGYVHFRPLPVDRGTVVTVHITYQPPAGQIGAGVAKALGRAPEQEVEQDLRRWKQLMEAGEVPTTDGQSSGRRSMLSRHLP